VRPPSTRAAGRGARSPRRPDRRARPLAEQCYADADAEHGLNLHHQRRETRRHALRHRDEQQAELPAAKEQAAKLTPHSTVTTTATMM
jgi:hypothetical protein